MNGSQRRSWKSWTSSAQPSYETQRLEGHWRHGGVLYRDNLVKVVVDVPDSAKNRRWLKLFKGRWMARLEQLELWMVSYRIEVE